MNKLAALVIAALCAAGFAPAPVAQADVFDAVLDPVINSLAGFDPALATDVSAALPVLEQDWITSSLGSQIDSALNGWFAQADPAALGDSCGLICNGTDGQDGGLLFGDNGPNAGNADSSQTLPPINCIATILPPTVDGAFLIAPAVGSCLPPTATIALSTEMYYDSIFPVGLPGFGVGVGGTDTTTAALCFPGFYSAYMIAAFFYPPGYTSAEIDPMTAVSTADITAC
jgi:hypothetical protein